MEKKIFDSILSPNEKINIDELRNEVLSKDFIQTEIKRLNLNEKQIKKGMGILQRYHDSVIKNHKKPDYKLFVDIYGFLAEDYSNDKEIIRSQQLEKFWLTSITELDPIFKKYFQKNNNSSDVVALKKTTKIFIDSLPKTIASEDIRAKFRTMITGKGVFDFNIWLWGANFTISNDIIKYIALMNVISQGKTVAFLNANELYNFLSSNKEEKQSICYYLNNVDVLFIANLSLGLKSQWFFDLLINIFETRIQKKSPIIISSTKDLLNKNTKLLTTYYYSKDNENDLEEVFKTMVANFFKKIVIS
ncbi:MULTISPECIES: hypothetical protein [unclassified Mycoplasma]